MKCIPAEPSSLVTLVNRTVEQIGNLSMDAATAHVAVPGHADVAVPKLVSADKPRMHWGKVHFHTRADLGAMYPEFETFQAVRARSDPNGIFLNDYTTTLFA